MKTGCPEYVASMSDHEIRMRLNSWIWHVAPPEDAKNIRGYDKMIGWMRREAANRGIHFTFARKLQVGEKVPFLEGMYIVKKVFVSDKERGGVVRFTDAENIKDLRIRWKRNCYKFYTEVETMEKNVNNKCEITVKDDMFKEHTFRQAVDILGDLGCRIDTIDQVPVIAVSVWDPIEGEVILERTYMEDWKALRIFADMIVYSIDIDDQRHCLNFTLRSLSEEEQAKLNR